MITPQKQIDYKRDLAELLARQAGDTSPVQHWTQGLGRLADGYNARKMRGEVKTAQENNNQVARGLLADYSKNPLAAAQKAYNLGDKQLSRQILSAGDANRRHSEMMQLRREQMSRNAEMDALKIEAVRQKNNGQRKLSATELKALYEAQDDLPNLQGTIENLERAKALLPKTNVGVAPELRAYIGNVTGLDEESSRATAEYAQIMGQQTFETMSRLLKGAMSDREMAAFQKIIGDTSLPHQVRQNALDRMIGAAKRHMEVKKRRINELRGFPGEQQLDQKQQDPLGIR